MKTIFRNLILFVSVCVQQVSAQYLEPTGKVKFYSFSISPIGSFRSNELPINFSNASLQVGKLWHKGIYYSLGYTYHQNNDIKQNSQRETNWNTPNFEQGHGINASIELKKLLFSNGGNTTSGLRCFYQNLGLSISPEYQYLLPVKGLVNSSKGEFSVRTGFYFHQGSTKKHKHVNFMYSIYYKKAFTPLMVVQTPVGKQEYMYDEAGIRITLLLKQLYRFDNFERK